MTAAPVTPSSAPVPSGLFVPDLTDDVDSLTAAMAYATGGLYVGPQKHHSKHPGSILGNAWQTQTSTDPQVIPTWFAGRDLGVFIHCLGLVVFDVDKPELVPDWMWKYLDTAPFQRSRDGGDPRKGHYLFACPPGRQFGNGLGSIPKGWGEIRGQGGIIVAAPTRHVFAAEGGHYHWARTGSIPVLPPEIADMLPDAAPGERVATTVEVQAFLRDHLDARKPWLAEKPVEWFANEQAKGSRHEAGVAAACWITRETAAGLYAARPAMEELYSAFVLAIGKDRDPLPEFRRMFAWAVGQLTPERIAEVVAKHSPPAPTTPAAPTTAPTASIPADSAPIRSLTVADLLDPSEPVADVQPATGDASATGAAPSQLQVVQNPATVGVPVTPFVDERSPEEIEAALIEHDARIELRRRKARQRADRLEAEELAAAKTYDDEFLDAKDLDQLPEPVPLIEGVLARHTYAILRGRDASFKSFVALDWSLCLATGSPWLGRTVEPVRVLYLAAEGAYGLQARIRAWEADHGIQVPRGALMIRKKAVNLFRGGAALEDLVYRVEDGEYGLVVLDTLRRVSGGADGNGSDMGIVVDNIARIREATSDGTVLTIAHTGKIDEDVRGFSGIEDDADGVWSCKRDEEGGNQVALKCTKAKDGPDGHALSLHARIVQYGVGEGLKPLSSLVLGLAASTTKVTMPESVQQQKVLVELRRLGSVGSGVKDLADDLGMRKQSVAYALSRLVSDGTVCKVGLRYLAVPDLGDSEQDRETA